MNKRSKEFLEKRKEIKLQQAWDKVSDYISKNSDGAWTNFVGTVQDGHYGHVVLYDCEQPVKLVSTKKYK